MAAVKTTLEPGGKLAIPRELQAALGVRPGDDVIVTLKGREIHVYAAERAIERAQALVRRYVPAGTSLVDELIAARRSEAERE